jgi:hypothetical protein
MLCGSDGLLKPRAVKSANSGQSSSSIGPSGLLSSDPDSQDERYWSRESEGRNRQTAVGASQGRGSEISCENVGISLTDRCRPVGECLAFYRIASNSW